MAKKIFAIIITVLTLGFSAAVCLYDVGPAGLTNTMVGFSSINEKMFNMLGTNMLCYDITTYLGYLALAIAAAWGFVGLIQWIRRKNLFEVDMKIIALGVLFIITISIYVVFTKVMINGRPILLPDETAVEPSFPSSHTILVLVVAGATIMIINDYISGKVMRFVIKALLAIVMAVMVAGRLLSGCHWMTDVIAGVLVGTTLLTWYSVVLDINSNGTGKSLRGYTPKH